MFEVQAENDRFVGCMSADPQPNYEASCLVRPLKWELGERGILGDRFGFGGLCLSPAVEREVLGKLWRRSSESIVD